MTWQPFPMHQCTTRGMHSGGVSEISSSRLAFELKLCRPLRDLAVDGCPAHPGLLAGKVAQPAGHAGQCKYRCCGAGRPAAIQGRQHSNWSVQMPFYTSASAAMLSVSAAS